MTPKSEQGDDRTMISARLPAELVEQLRAVSALTGVPQNTMVEDGVRHIVAARIKEGDLSAAVRQFVRTRGHFDERG